MLMKSGTRAVICLQSKLVKLISVVLLACVYVKGFCEGNLT